MQNFSGGEQHKERYKCRHETAGMVSGAVWFAIPQQRLLSPRTRLPDQYVWRQQGTKQGSQRDQKSRIAADLRNKSAYYYFTRVRDREQSSQHVGKQRHR